MLPHRPSSLRRKRPQTMNRSRNRLRGNLRPYPSKVNHIHHRNLNTITTRRRRHLATNNLPRIIRRLIALPHRRRQQSRYRFHNSLHRPIHIKPRQLLNNKRVQPKSRIIKQRIERSEDMARHNRPPRQADTRRTYTTTTTYASSPSTVASLTHTTCESACS